MFVLVTVVCSSSGSGVGDMDWIDLAQGRDRQRVLVNAVMNVRIPFSAREFLTS